MIRPAAGRLERGFSASHPAIDISNTKGTPIVAPVGGIVSFVGQMGTGTNNAGLVVQIGGELNGHRLCHLDRAVVTAKQHVAEGQLVGYMGNSGYVIPGPGGDGTHLHWVMFKNGNKVNGLQYITSNAPTQGAPTPVSRDALTKEEDIELHTAYFMSAPGAGYNFRNVGKSLSEAIQFYKSSPYRKAAVDRYKAFETLSNQIAQLRIRAAELADRPTKESFNELEDKIAACQANAQKVSDAMAGLPASPKSNEPSMLIKLLAKLFNVETKKG